MEVTALVRGLYTHHPLLVFSTLSLILPAISIYVCLTEEPDIVSLVAVLHATGITYLAFYSLAVNDELIDGIGIWRVIIVTIISTTAAGIIMSTSIDLASPYWRNHFLENLVLFNLLPSFLPIFVKYTNRLARERNHPRADSASGESAREDDSEGRLPKEETHFDMFSR